MEEDLPFPSLLDCSSILISFYNSQNSFSSNSGKPITPVQYSKYNVVLQQKAQKN